MAWAKIDDQLHGHPKIKAAWRLSRAAVGLHMLAMSYCAAYGTEGFVPADFVEEKLPDADERATALAALTAAPAMAKSALWEQADGGWRIHDWAEYNGDPKTRERVREAKSRAGKAGAAARWGNGRAMAGARAAANGKAIAPSPSPNPEGKTANAVSSGAVPAPDPEVVRLCALHSQLSRARAGAPETSRRMLPTKSWHAEMDRLLRLDGWTPEQVEYVIRWVDRDPFWGTNCLSVESLRRNFEKFAARIRSEQQPKARPAGLTDEKNDARRARAVAAFGDLMTPTEPAGSDTIDGREAA